MEKWRIIYSAVTIRLGATRRNTSPMIAQRHWCLVPEVVFLYGGEGREVPTSVRVIVLTGG